MKEIFLHILDLAYTKKYSDVHLNTGSLPIIRDNSGNIQFLKELKNADGTTIPLSELSKNQIEDIILMIA